MEGPVTWKEHRYGRGEGTGKWGREEGKGETARGEGRGEEVNHLFAAARSVGLG